jgi:mannose-6-phosphate isomerase-like protein (cupin superfamily)
MFNNKMDLENVKIVDKVWGKEIWMANTDLYCGKKLILEKGKRVSLHHHKNKDETFYIDSGKVLMQLGDEEKILKPGDCVRISQNVWHRFTGLEPSVIIEISTHHEDSDSYRKEGELSGEAPKEVMEKYNEN